MCESLDTSRFRQMAQANQFNLPPVRTHTPQPPYSPQMDGPPGPLLDPRARGPMPPAFVPRPYNPGGSGTNPLGGQRPTFPDPINTPLPDDGSNPLGRGLLGKSLLALLNSGGNNVSR